MKARIAIEKSKKSFYDKKIEIAFSSHEYIFVDV